MTDMVNVAVPVDRLQEVYALLAKRPVRHAVVHATDEGYPHGWNQDLIDRMFVESSTSMRRVLRAVAQESPNWVTTGDIADSSGLTARQVIAALGPFEKRCRGRYGMSERPFAAREFAGEGILKYSMLPAVASRILDLVAQVEADEKVSV